MNTEFEVGMYRPPSEGGSHSLLVRVTRNCPWNRCEFCAMYKTEKFTLRSPAEVKKDIDTIAHYLPGAVRTAINRQRDHPGCRHETAGT